MAGNGTAFEEYLREEARKYNGVLVPVKAPLIERLFERNVKCSRLHPNPDDEFNDPTVGPNNEIISEYVHQIKERSIHQDPLFDEPLLVEKMMPDGYLILNGHHRWAACMRLGVPTVKVRVVNLTHDTDIQRMIKESVHDKRASFDLDETVFASGDIPAQKPPDFIHKRLFKERLRNGIPALFHLLAVHGYDIWVYTSGYYSIEYIRKLFFSYHVHVTGIVTGTARPAKDKDAKRKELETLIRDKYQETIHIDDHAIMRTLSATGDLEQYDLTGDTGSWSLEVINTLKSVFKKETVLS